MFCCIMIKSESIYCSHHKQRHDHDNIIILHTLNLMRTIFMASAFYVPRAVVK